MKNFNKLTLLSTLAAALFISHSTHANMSPVGLWKTINEDTKEAKSYVRITEHDGVLTGKIETILNKAKQDALCSECNGDKKNQPMLGMTIIEDVTYAGDGSWEDGEILDPNNGKTYSVRLTPKQNGEQLEVRGYVGFFYRNQYWLKVE